MTLRQKRIIWFSIWLFVILAGPISVIRNTSLPIDTNNLLVLTSIFQRLTGLVGLSLIFSQIMLGAFMKNWVQILGARAYRAHVTQGLLAYGFIVLHPLMQMAIDYQVSGLSGAMSTFLSGRNIFINFGIVALLLSSAAVIIAYMRTKPIFRRAWRKIHILNYVSFFLVSYHALNLGTDVSTLPFILVHRGAFFLVIGIVLYRVYSLLTTSKFGVKIRLQ